MLSLGPIPRRESAVEACAQRLRRAILGGELTPGTRLPPERRLAESFGVNRVTVRSALAQLATAGLVSVRQGSGHVVRDYRQQGGPDLLDGIASLAASRGELTVIVSDLFLVRRQLARAVLERLSERTDIDSAPIERALDAFANAATAGADDLELAHRDVAVLAAVVDATGSAVLRLSLNPVLAVLSGMPALRRAVYAEPQDNVAGYRVLLAWLEQRSSKRRDPKQREPKQRELGAITAIIAELERRDRRTLQRINETELSA